MRTIWKFETPFEEKFTINMPIGAEILCIQQDQKTMKPCIWAVVETENQSEERYFELYGTGNEISADAEKCRMYIGTYQYQRGAFVGHLFEIV